MTNLKDTNRGCRTGACKTRVWPTTDPTKTCSDHPLDRQTRPPRTTLLSFGTCWNRVMCCRQTPYPSPFQYPESCPALSYHDQSTDSIAAVLLLHTVVTALCAVNSVGLSQDTLPSPLPIASLSKHYYSYCTTSDVYGTPVSVTTTVNTTVVGSNCRILQYGSG